MPTTEQAEPLLVWLCIGLLAGITIIHARALQKLAYDVEFRKIVAREQEEA